MDYTLRERAITHHAGPVRVGGYKTYPNNKLIRFLNVTHKQKRVIDRIAIEQFRNSVNRLSK
jgi:hypothetical protein